ncbi:heavy metal-associated isoprenylated plant protein 37-like [Zingiber officinale]|uniref:HMA domain-containing protein n=1 Tax=Zingiber officinale TaxID=94328 RepID=A0A8J5LTT4_ZINOF|nr:heavy metal-associated isoprenylated plant protein 37-like [Zingiber officinale]KAG6538739.1 hypothetical protein ZIOFF_003867 [Zingiber officinale]
MGKEEHFEVLKVKTHILKVNIHCHGCKLKVKKLLHRIQGVFSVDIDLENQKVTVQANVDSSTLIKKLIRAGKHAELWPQKSSDQSNNKKQNSQTAAPAKDNKKKNKEQWKEESNLKPSKVLHRQLHLYSSDDKDYDSNDEDSEDLEDGLHLLHKIQQNNLIRQRNNSASGANKAGNKNASNESRNKAGGNENPDLNANIAALQKMMIDNANGFQANAYHGGVQSQGPMMVNYQGQAHHPSAMMRGHNMMKPQMMMRDHNMQQPQMMYLRSPQVSPYSGYYSCFPAQYNHQNYLPCDDYVTHLFCDENPGGCVIM